MVLDSSTNGALIAKTFDEVVEIVDHITKNNYEWTIDDPSSRQLTMQHKLTGIIENDQMIALNAQMQVVHLI